MRHLGLLVGGDVPAEWMVAVDESVELLKERARSDAPPGVRTEFDFSVLSSPRWRLYADQLESRSPGEVLLWIPTSPDCGLLRLPSLSRFQPTFPLEEYPEDILTLLTVDGDDSLLLDWGSYDDERLVELESNGARWAGIPF